MTKLLDPMIEQKILIRLNAENKFRYCNCKVILSVSPLQGMAKESPEKKKELGLDVTSPVLA